MNVELLQRLVSAHGTAGDEGPVRGLLQELCAPYADEMRTDAMGNLIVRKGGQGAKLLLCAHMDGVGFMATHFEKEGVIRFASVGGLDASTIVQAPVRFKNGVSGLISCDEDKLEKGAKLRELFVDVGASDAEEARGLVAAGDTAMFDLPLRTRGSRIMGPYLDNRAGCLVLLEVLRQMETPRNDLCFVFSAQEEVGTRGAGSAAYGIDAHWALVVDVTCPDDVPGALHEGTTALGKGAAVKVMDHSVICHPAVTQRLNRLAAEQGIPVQQDVLTCGGTDAGVMQRCRSGLPTGGVSIPCRYTHTPTELIDWKDLEACTALVRAFCESEFE
jgi:endoglucanase